MLRFLERRFDATLFLDEIVDELGSFFVFELVLCDADLIEEFAPIIVQVVCIESLLRIEANVLHVPRLYTDGED